MTRQKIVSAIPTKASAIKNMVAAVKSQLTAGVPGRNARGIRLYQPAPKLDIGEKNMSKTPDSIIHKDALAHFKLDSGFLPHLLVA